MVVGYLANDKMAPAQFQTQDLWCEPARGQPEGLTLSHRWTWGINLMDSYTDLSSNHSFAWAANSSDFGKKKPLLGMAYTEPSVWKSPAQPHTFSSDCTGKPNSVCGHLPLTVSQKGAAADGIYFLFIWAEVQAEFRMWDRSYLRLHGEQSQGKGHERCCPHSPHDCLCPKEAVDGNIKQMSSKWGAHPTESGTAGTARTWASGPRSVLKRGNVLFSFLFRSLYDVF